MGWSSDNILVCFRLWLIDKLEFLFLLMSLCVCQILFCIYNIGKVPSQTLSIAKRVSSHENFMLSILNLYFIAPYNNSTIIYKHK